jgi:hypothetical protein
LEFAGQAFTWPLTSSVLFFFGTVMHYPILSLIRFVFSLLIALAANGMQRRASKQASDQLLWYFLDLGTVGASRVEW